MQQYDVCVYRAAEAECHCYITQENDRRRNQTKLWPDGKIVISLWEEIIPDLLYQIQLDSLLGNWEVNPLQKCPS